MFQSQIDEYSKLIENSHMTPDYNNVIQTFPDKESRINKSSYYDVEK